MKTFFKSNKLKSSFGFTLIELIMVIILISIIGLVGGSFIAQSFRGFSQSENRIDIYEEGKIALVRMEREVHNAIPNAFNPSTIGNDDLQFGMINELAMQNVFGQYTNNNPNTFIDDRITTLVLGSIISINNLSWAHFISGTPRLYLVIDITHPSGRRMNLATTIQDPQSDGRFYAVNSMVRYCLDTNTLRRSSMPINAGNYNASPSFPVGCAGQPIATNVRRTAPAKPIFSYQPGTSTNSPLVTIDFRIAPLNGENINFHKEIMIVNVP